MDVYTQGGESFLLDISRWNDSDFSNIKAKSIGIASGVEDVGAMPSKATQCLEPNFDGIGTFKSLEHAFHDARSFNHDVLIWNVSGTLRGIL